MLFDQFSTKKEIAGVLGISGASLRKIMNKNYYPLLSPTGYKKSDKSLSPKVLNILGEELGFDQERVFTYQNSLKKKSSV